MFLRAIEKDQLFPNAGHVTGINSITLISLFPLQHFVELSHKVQMEEQRILPV